MSWRVSGCSTLAQLTNPQAAAASREERMIDGDVEFGFHGVGFWLCGLIEL